MSAEAFKYSASWKMYDQEGLQVYFHVGGEDVGEHALEFITMLSSLKEMGFQVNPPEQKPGLALEEVDAYVMGETSKGDSCIYLYSSNHSLKWRIITVYQEDFDRLPFVPTGKVWDGSAPEREMAEKKRALVELGQPIVVVMEPRYAADGTVLMTEKGKPVYEFQSVKGVPIPTKKGAPSSAQTSEQKTEKTTEKKTEKTPEEEPLWMSWKTSADAEKWAVKLGVFPEDPEEGPAKALKHLYNEMNKPTKAELYAKWMDVCLAKMDAMIAALRNRKNVGNIDD